MFGIYRSNTCQSWCYYVICKFKIFSNGFLFFEQKLGRGDLGWRMLGICGADLRNLTLRVNKTFALGFKCHGDIKFRKFFDPGTNGTGRGGGYMRKCLSMTIRVCFSTYFENCLSKGSQTAFFSPKNQGFPLS